MNSALVRNCIAYLSQAAGVSFHNLRNPKYSERYAQFNVCLNISVDSSLERLIKNISSFIGKEKVSFDVYTDHYGYHFAWDLKGRRRIAMRQRYGDTYVELTLIDFALQEANDAKEASAK